MPTRIKIICYALPIVSFSLCCTHFGFLQTLAIALLVFSGCYVAMCVVTQHCHDLWNEFFELNK